MKDMGIHVAYKRLGILVFSEIPCHGRERDGKSSEVTSKPIMVENTSPGSSKNIAPSMESSTRRRFLVHHSTMVLQRG